MYLRLLSPLLLCCCSLFGAAASQENLPPSGDQIIRLPEISITETMKLRPEEKWLTGTVGNFEVFSTASEKNTREFVASLHKFHQAFTSLFPNAKAAAQKKITLVLCDKVEKFEALMPTQESRNDRAMVSHFAADEFQTVFLINMDLESVTISSAGTTMVEGEYMRANVDRNASDLIEKNEPIRREYLHLIFRQFPQRVPPWAEEGTIQFFLSMKIEDKRITWGEIDKEFINSFTARALLPLPKLFSITYDSPEYLQSLGSMFSAQSRALVHLCMFGNKGKYQKPLLQLIDRSAHEPVTEELFKQIFGINYRQMEDLISDYIDRKFYKHIIAPKTATFSELPAFELRETTDAESGRIKGETLRLVKRYDDARIELLSAIIRKHTDGRLLGALGQLDFETGNLKSARKYLEESTAAKVDAPAPYLALARLRLQDALSQNPSAKLAPAQLQQILTPLFAALELNQPPVEIYTLIADAWDRSQIAPSFDNLVVLDQGVIAYPRNTDLILKNATLKARHGFTDDARSVAELGLKTARNSADRARFSQFIATLPAPVSK